MKWLLNRNTLREVASIFVIAQSLASGGGLQRRAESYAERYTKVGYTLPERIVVTEAVNGDGSLSGLHAGGWSPGVIGLRANPTGLFGIDQYLAHELAHEAVFRTCGGIPEWKSEALAMLLSGELAQVWEVEQSALKDRVHDRKLLWESVRGVRSFEPGAARALRQILRAYAHHKQRPCELPEAAAQALRGPVRDETPRWVALSLSSGRLLAKKGDIFDEVAPASLLKLLYVASDTRALSVEQVQGLLRSDEDQIRGSSSFDLGRYMLMSAPLRDHSSLREVPPAPSVLMGQADAASYPLQGSLQAIAQAVRSAILLKGRSSWSPLVKFDEDEKATIGMASQSVRQLIREQSGWVKTGTASLHDGTPTEGVIAVVWPATDPTVLLVAARNGVKGAQVWNGDEPTLNRVMKLLAPFSRDTKSEVLSLLPRNSFSIKAPFSDTSCERLILDDGGITSTCGAIEIETTVKGALRRRFFHGVLSFREDALVLRTDPYTYGEYVVEGEVAREAGELREAVQMVGGWNSANGNHGHRWGTVCDTSHCMVQKGSSSQLLPPISPEQLERVERIFRMLSEFAARRGERWFEFSYSKPAEWSRTVPVIDVTARMGLEGSLSVYRQRNKGGDVAIVFSGDEVTHVTTCDTLMVKLDLPSCPSRITQEEGLVAFQGDIVGHGRGLSIWDWNRRCIESHCSVEEILRSSYG